jgi:TIR domain-containing protein
MPGKLIFISHSTKDMWLVTPFVEKILNLGLGIPRAKIFYTSNKDTTIKSGQDFKRVIKNNLIGSKAVIQIITDNYKQSEICLNEMGAAWLLASKVIPFVFPPIRFDNVGFIHNTTQLLKISDEADLFKFQDDHPELKGVAKINQANYHQQVKDFLEIVVRGGGGFGFNSWK